MKPFVRITILGGTKDWKVLIEEGQNAKPYTFKTEKELKDFMIRYFAEVE